MEDEGGLKLSDLTGHEAKIVLAGGQEIYCRIIEYDQEDRSLSVEQRDPATKKVLGYRNIKIRGIRQIEVMDYSAV
ncbi:MAG: hypothetical protein ACP5G5_05035 [Thermoplasmata archaeon]